ncbi:MAG: histidine triad nucleotide-binding protein [Candidatus Zixiibacteriota bacterium]|nr:MAG: histidine triad nucleotide-binding protein [candidate division Zixibacteria bacterium]
MTCIFCKIVEHKSPARIFFEDSDIIVFADIHPRADVHLLVTPKAHYARIIDLPDNLTLKIFDTVRTITRELDLYDNFRLVLHNGALAGQIIEHLHFHYLSNQRNADVKYKTVIT